MGAQEKKKKNSMQFISDYFAIDQVTGINVKKNYQNRLPSPFCACLCVNFFLTGVL